MLVLSMMISKIVFILFFSFNGYWGRRVEEERASSSWHPTLRKSSSTNFNFKTPNQKSKRPSSYHQPEEYWGCSSYSCYVNNVIRRLSGEYSEENIIQQNITYKKVIENKMMAAIKKLENKNKQQKANQSTPPNEFEQIKEIIKHKATKHSEFYR